MSLFVREPETLDGYIPKFSLEEFRMNFKVTTTKDFPGFGPIDDEYVETYSSRVSITVLNHTIHGLKDYKDYYGNQFDIVASLVNEFISSDYNKRNYPEVYNFLTNNSVELNNSRRYWEAYQHRQEIEKTRKKAEELLDQCRRAEWIASMYAVQVKAERWISTEEKNLLLAEFSGGEYNASN